MKKAVILLCLLFAVFLLNACQTTTGVEGITGEEISSVPTIEQNIKAPVRQIPIDPLTYISASQLELQVTPVGNLLANPGFEFGSLDGWTACESGAIQLSNDAYEGSGALKVNAGNCFYQSVAINPDTELTLSCYAKILSGNAWTGMGLGFADSNWNTIGDGASTVITGNSYQRYDVKATAPANTKYVSMWFYSDNPAVVDNCSLYPEDDPPPPPPSGDNLLENPFFLGLDNWSAGCSGTAGVTGDGLLMGGGACVDQSLSASDIAALQGKEYTYSCVVQKTSGYASMSIFLDGQPSSVVIPNSNSFQTIELKGTAGSNISSGFVSIYAEGTLLVKSCSLLVDDIDPPLEPKITIRNLGSDTITSGNPVQVNLEIENSGNVAFNLLNVSSQGNILACGFNIPNVPVGNVSTYTCTTPSIAPGETKTYTIIARATVDDNGTPITITETYTITQTNSVQTQNLIENGNFEGSFTDTWTVGCGGTYSLPPGRSGQGAQPLSGACIDQSLSSTDLAALAGKAYTYSCYAKNVGGYASISIFFDGQSTSEVIPVSNDFQRVEITGTAPNASSGFVSIYSGGNNLIIDDCMLEVEGGGVEPGTLQWFDRFGAEDIDEVVNTIGLTSSGVYSVGTVTNTIDNNRNGFIRKYDRDGNVIFAQSVTNNRNTEQASVDADGNTYILQTTRTPIAGTNFATLAAYIQKYSPTGTLLFDKLVKSTDYFTGGSSGAAFYTDLIVTSNALYLNGRNVGLNKFDLSGNALWTSGVSRPVIGGIAISPDESSIYLTDSDRGLISPRLSKFNAGDGALVWEQVLPNGYEATELVADNANVYLMGNTANTFTNEEADTRDGYLWKYDSAGNQIWTSQYATNLNDVLTHAALYNGALYVTGSTDRNGFIKKINTQTAAEEWSVDLDIEVYDIYNDIAIDSTGIYVGGYLAALGTVGNSQFPTNSDGFVAKYSLP